ncbi:potassium channel family protein [Sporolactobacillus inulinus]|uniref:Potassium channel domain-containing protein n=1 Tax=Sporolactobacillus inulinus CASD TaxID=1069536 RepID=A0A0U1QLQ9_9BACL|nr:potassium channel family protein [Sporolactobacillus inulinus]KLI01747.1 hypothetical protein SINU_11795 [Sporolactobacillus inulinus CASD]GEB78522.1 hypothetical protein SIN01_28670 [Sporolactobacillus inulinus]
MPATIQFEFLFEKKGKKLAPIKEKYQLQTKENSLTITPEFLYQYFPNLKDKEKVVGFNAHIDCDKLFLVIKEFTYFTLQKFGLSSGNVALLKVFDISDFFRINGLSVERFDVERSNNLIANCNIQELNIGIATNYDLIGDSSNKSPNPINTDIRESKLNRIRLFVPQARVNIQNSSCEKLVFESPVRIVEDLHIWENTTIDMLTFIGDFKKIQIKNSNLRKMLFTKNAQVEDIDIESAIIENIHNADEKTFKNKTLDNWLLIAESAKNANNPTLFSLANFEYLKLERKSNTNYLQKLLNISMELTSGYGYRPFRTVLSSLLIWILFAILYWLISIYANGGLRLINGEIISGLKGLGYAAYFSLITFTTTAFGDITPVGLLAKLFAGIQTLLGITFMSLFIFALTKRYGSFK